MLKLIMGYFAEVNTLLRLTKDFGDIKDLEIDKVYTIEKDNERIFPVHTAMLLEGSDDIFYGYCEAISVIVKKKKTIIEFKVLSLFTSEERNIYTKRFMEAARMTGEIS